MRKKPVKTQTFKATSMLLVASMLCVACMLLAACGTDAEQTGTSVTDSYTAESEENVSSKTEAMTDGLVEESEPGSLEQTEGIEETQEALESTQEDKESLESSATVDATEENKVAGATEETKTSTAADASTKASTSTAGETTKESQTVKESQAAQGSSSSSKDQSSSGAASSNTSQSGVHTCSFTSGSVTQAATCTADGVKTYTCSCGKTKTETIKATGHTLVTESQAVTCTEKGYTKTYCSSCDYVKSYEETQPTGHDMYEWWFNEPTCTSPGWGHVNSCRNCDYAEDLPEGALGCERDEGVIYDEGDCSSPARVEYHCKRCGVGMGEGVLPSLHPDAHYWVVDADTGIEFCVNGCGAVK